MTVYSSGIIIYDVAGIVTMDLMEVAESSLGILVLYDATVKGNSRLTISDSPILNQLTLLLAGGLSAILVDQSNITTEN